MRVWGQGCQVCPRDARGHCQRHSHVQGQGRPGEHQGPRPPRQGPPAQQHQALPGHRLHLQRPRLCVLPGWHAQEGSGHGLRQQRPTSWRGLPACVLYHWPHRRW
ncbi:hypothetical protein mRhiFer1_009895 [Rhinolophus ferrumequinum]|nr:hypothetical protein mRhiFer1_009895 [Rhinolophus ferrumequinum]